MPSLICILCNHSKALEHKKIGKSFHRLPDDNEQRKIWLSIIGKTNFRVENNAYLCSDHFNSFDILTLPSGRKFLRKGSLPIHYDSIYAEFKDRSSTEWSDDIYGLNSPSGTETASECEDEVINQLNGNGSETETATESVGEENNKHIEVNRVMLPEISETDSSSDIENGTFAKSRRYRKKQGIYYKDFSITQMESPKRARRFFQVAGSLISRQTRMIRSMQQEHRRLKNKIDNLKSLISYVSDGNKSLSNDIA
ncbi:hypothetical protein HHI36_005788 [Cryptolaemus montrouzieri]|uniref:THAP-type domain-containing protein n=1 Tax=Cryptolaemus montrouzieri TaxID=559131 RepID=A0ABD2NV75_9CUCU